MQSGSDEPGGLPPDRGPQHKEGDPHNDGVHLDRRDGRFWTVGVKCIGASHLQSGHVCQDAVSARFCPDNGATTAAIVAVADGHGSSAYDRSDVGSQLAAELAVNMLCNLWADGEVKHPALVSRFGAEFPRILVRKWRERVLEHASRAAPTDQAAAQPIGGDDEATIRRYGTTLIVGLVAPDLCLVGQIGDGDAVLLREAGPIELIEPETEQRIGSETHSLCQPSAARHWRSRVMRGDEAGVLMLSTDGLSDSFATRADFRIFGTDLCNLLRTQGLDVIIGKLPDWLDGYSRGGSGDDITIALASASGQGITKAATDAPP